MHQKENFPLVHYRGYELVVLQGHDHMKYRIGIDLGGTKVGIGVVDEHANLLFQSEIPTRVSKDEELSPRDLAKRILDATNELCSLHQINAQELESIGVGVPGTVDTANGIIVYANNLDFVQVPFVSYLEDYFHVPVRMDNDANVAAWAEYKAGQGKDKALESFVMMTLGTGVGAGFVFHDRLFAGCNQGAGEIGHMVIDIHGKPCNCGRRGCFENYASATALIEAAQDAMEAHPESILWSLCADKNNMNGKLFFEAIRQKDETAQAVLNQYMTYLSVGVLNIINSLQPDMLVIGGGISKAGELILTPLCEQVEKLVYTKDDNIQTQIVMAKLGNEAGILGAALL